ncbi:Zinc finger C2HC domain-containing protein 1C [Boothiomyces macroporosus]|uniref:Zinc finger C2HC domain-containing protein 1C n=1 Tax=Boothiomyces macroporosus TaxID=261099 RepID=A0AAD5YB08_9FUNG|nr:Zinc finger C2HC domain-containing protein 1C [Boothiomyces macroporosus]
MTLDAISQFKKETLFRINSKFKQPVKKADSSFRSLEDARQEYIVRLKDRINRLGDSPAHSTTHLPKTKRVTIKSQSEPEIRNIDLIPCKHCKRKFSSDRVKVHESKCKNVQKSRPVFDEQAMRKRGTELEEFEKKKPTRKRDQDRAKSAVVIRKTHPFSAVSTPPAGTTCPYCNRAFSEDAFERHVPICEKLSTKPKRHVFAK